MCSIPWCKELPVLPTNFCLTHISEYTGDGGPALSPLPGNPRRGALPRDLGKLFFLDETKDGCQVREVPESFYAPEIPIKSQPETGGSSPEKERM